MRGAHWAALAVVLGMSGLGLGVAASARERGHARPDAVAARLKHNRQLRGFIHVKQFTFAHGTVYDVGRSLTIIATGPVRVNGPIKLAPGAALTIKAGSIAVDASIGPASTTGRTHKGPGCPAPGIGLQAAGDISIDAPVSAGPGGTEPDGQGCRGGNIGMRSKTKVAIHAPIRSGDGGPGGVKGMTEGRAGLCRGGPGPATTVKTGSGGTGGVIAISGASPQALLFVPSLDLRSGDGGHGGDVGTSEHPLRGGITPPEHSGLGLVAVTGNGGDGGDILVSHEGSAEPPTHLGTPGRGGRAGSAYLSPGDGGEPNCNGGNGTALLGRDGRPGAGTLTPPATPTVDADFEQGGDGAGPATSAHDPSGGNGGVMTVGLDPTPEPGATAEPRVSVSALKSGNGGNGFDGCAPSPPKAGGAGGMGGQLVIKTLGHVAVIAHQSFNGADGGGGLPPGARGEAGTTNFADAINIASFDPGANGVACPGTTGQEGHFGTWVDTNTHNYICVYLKGPPGQQGTVTIHGDPATSPAPGLKSANPVSFTLDNLGQAVASWTIDYGGVTYHYSVVRKQPDGTLKGGEDDSLLLPFGGNGDHGPSPPADYAQRPCSAP